MAKNGWFYEYKKDQNRQIRLYHVLYENGKIKTKRLEKETKSPSVLFWEKQIINADELIKTFRSEHGEYISTVDDKELREFLNWTINRYEFELPEMYTDQNVVREQNKKIDELKDFLTLNISIGDISTDMSHELKGFAIDIVDYMKPIMKIKSQMNEPAKFEYHDIYYDITEL